MEEDAAAQALVGLKRKDHPSAPRSLPKVGGAVLKPPAAAAPAPAAAALPAGALTVAAPAAGGGSVLKHLRFPAFITGLSTPLLGILRERGPFSVVVAPGQPVQAAVNDCPRGGSVLLLPGIHEGPLTLAANQEVHVFGRSLATLRCVRFSAVISAAVKSSLVGITIRREVDMTPLGGLACREGYAVHITEGNLRLQSCNIVNASPAAGICIQGGSNPVVAMCTIRDCGKSGIIIHGAGTTGRVEGCIIAANRFSNVTVNGGADPLVTGCKIYNGQQCGILFYGATTKGRVICSEIYGNNRPGLMVNDGASPLIAACKIFNGLYGGVCFEGASTTGHLECCELWGNHKAGVAILNGSNPLVTSSGIYSGPQAGLLIMGEGTKGWVEACEVTANGMDQVIIGNCADPKLVNCKIHDGRTMGVRVFENAKGRIERCEIWGNASGDVGNGGSAALIGNTSRPLAPAVPAVPAARPPAPMPTVTIAGYQWLACLGVGVHNSLHAYIDTTVNQLKAVKLIARGLKDDSSWAQRETELQNYLRIGCHPGLTSFLGASLEGPWLVMSYQLARSFKLDVAQQGEGFAHRTLQQVMDAVHHMHALGIPHRNISAYNLMVSNEATMEIKLAFFGEFSGGGKLAARFKAPDASGSDVLKADMWSCGAMMFYLIFGSFYVPTQDVAESGWWKQVPVGAFPISPSCESLLDALLHPVPAERIDAASALLHPWLRGHAPLGWPRVATAHSGGVLHTVEHVQELIARARAV